MNIANRLKELRLSKNLTQTELSKALNIGQTTIASYESGKNQPHIMSLIAYAKFFECTIDYLAGLEDDFEEVSFTPAPPPALPADEKELLDLYRQLNYEGKQRLLARAEVMIEDAQQQQNKSNRHA